MITVIAIAAALGGATQDDARWTHWTMGGEVAAVIEIDAPPAYQEDGAPVTGWVKLQCKLTPEKSARIELNDWQSGPGLDPETLWIAVDGANIGGARVRRQNGISVVDQPDGPSARQTMLDFFSRIQRGRTLTLSTSSGFSRTYPLTGARAAIAPVLAACAVES